MARMKITPRKGEQGKARWVRAWAEVHAVPGESPALAEPPVPTKEAPQTPGEVERRRVEMSKLEELGRSPELSPTQQLAQMAEEATPSMSGGEELARKKLQPIGGGKAPRKEFLEGQKSTEALEVLAGDSGSL